MGKEPKKRKTKAAKELEEVFAILQKIQEGFETLSTTSASCMKNHAINLAGLRYSENHKKVESELSDYHYWRGRAAAFKEAIEWLGRDLIDWQMRRR